MMADVACGLIIIGALALVIWGLDCVGTIAKLEEKEARKNEKKYFNYKL